MLGSRGQLEASEVSVDGILLQRADFRLRIGRFGDAAWGLAPMIKHVWDMADPRPSLADSQHELEVLDAVEDGIESNFLGEVSPHKEKMTDVHDASKILWRPRRLEKRLDQLTGLLIKLVLVGINYVVAFK